LLFNVDFADYDASLVFDGKFINHGSDLPAGTAPRCPKVDENRSGGSQNVNVKTFGSKFCGHSQFLSISD
jgi:hypothetical protein